ncbi:MULTISPECIES: L-type lectin-domain containing protein [Actinoplanes]|uniref:L-type lectin-domain containing protein n=1 Tax=Actinoplanes TaxID=1865 RepID=UPI0005F29F0E|nr:MULTISPECIES: L-type lectin-domain containing protein [Actinoplanes]GLY05581.1 hypothetical protein Acsp01_59600 [Actinoplanes sp. NBRC 101535]
MRSLRKTRVVRGGFLAAALLALAAVAPPALAAPGQDRTVTPLSGGHLDDLSLNGTAQVVADRDGRNRFLRLTSGSFRQAGSAWSTRQIDLTRSFTTTFVVNMHRHGKPGADGIAFVVQGTGPRALGGWGGGLGYRGIRQSVAIEFDTYRNGQNDPAGEHLAVTRAGNPDRHLATVPAPIPLYGRPFQVRLSYDAATTHLTVHVRARSKGATERVAFDRPLDLAKESGVTSAWIGFTGSTGDITSSQDVYGWTIDVPSA